ncbi:purple acid phosphatase family protein [Chitinophaga nivalis]|uniref:Metallophosphoesterase family protein n=1 Tax=Chitinophaga nivalis TaxID=2991709 RepID=A0ABT3IM25_9BACT|nr:metallophosphoesterase family protein [Chitinophaga nivalis]MCW3465286.1 metallophosphoesterase family protein [Chitinophaga nivalis]MCW3485022.1 metallophosphoesterase family protein [Chitinophaga nivalis]
MEKKIVGRRNFLSRMVKAGVLLPLAGTSGLAAATAAAPTDLAPDPGYTASAVPDRIILNITKDPATTAAITWRTNTAATAYVEYAIADARPAFAAKATRLTAKTETLQYETLQVYYHSLTLTGLQPDTLYTYRAGNDEGWSEWLQFRTAATTGKLSFIYLGDAQVGIKPFWSRVIRKAYAQMPEAKLIIHAGDLVNRANKDDEWGQWFDAGGYIHGTVPSLVTPGNHEYTHEDGLPHLSVHWKKQFTLPANGTGLDALEGSVFYADIQGVRFISLNTQMMEEATSESLLQAQQQWLENTLATNPNKWTVVTMHHPVFSTKKGRINEKVKAGFKPLFDKYKVDIVLQGHDHAYGRGMQQIAPYGTAYVVSVSGSKMYEYEKMEWADIVTGHLQMYHLVTIDNHQLDFRSYLATGELFDAFILEKRAGKINKFKENKPA